MAQINMLLIIVAFLKNATIEYLLEFFCVCVCVYVCVPVCLYMRMLTQ